MCVYQAWVNSTIIFIPVEKCSWTGWKHICRPTSSLPRKVKRWASVNWRRSTYRSTNLLWWGGSVSIMLHLWSLFQGYGLQAFCMLIGVSVTSCVWTELRGFGLSSYSSALAGFTFLLGFLGPDPSQVLHHRVWLPRVSSIPSSANLSSLWWGGFIYRHKDRYQLWLC